MDKAIRSRDGVGTLCGKSALTPQIDFALVLKLYT